MTTADSLNDVPTTESCPASVGILGGTFDPPHRGHLDMARIACRSRQVDYVWLVPCFRHAFGKTPVAFSHRVAMCERLVMNAPAISVCDIEQRIAHPGRTLCLLDALIHRYPQYRFRLVAGADIYLERHKWYRFDQVAALAPPIFLARHGVSLPNVPLLDAPPDISATHVRNRLRQGKSVDAMVPGPVVDYIKHNNLYGG